MKEPNEKTIEGEETIADVYDMYKTASDVHSKNTNMSKDYTLAKYNSTILNEKLPKFVINQRKIVRILENHMIPSLKTLIDKYGKEKAIKMHIEMTKNFKQVEKLLLGEVDEMVVMTRAGKGDIITAMLMHGKSQETQEEYTHSIEHQGIMGKMKEKRK